MTPPVNVPYILSVLYGCVFVSTHILIQERIVKTLDHTTLYI